MDDGAERIGHVRRRWSPESSLFTVYGKRVIYADVIVLMDLTLLSKLLNCSPNGSPRNYE